jgi:hypothetical protein
MKLSFDISDITWMLFLSEPMDFICESFLPPNVTLAPGVIQSNNAFFKLYATKPLNKGMVRLAMLNNCTTGQNAECILFVLFELLFLLFLYLDCGDERKSRDSTEYEYLLRKHSEIYPTSELSMFVNHFFTSSSFLLLLFSSF